MTKVALSSASSSSQDDSDAVWWLQMTSRILSGEIAPHEARAMLNAARQREQHHKQSPSAN